MKVSVIRPAIRQTAFAAAVGVSLLIAPELSAQAIVPAAVASPPPAQVTTAATAEVKRVIVTGSNIPTAEETGPNPVDTIVRQTRKTRHSQCNGPDNFSAAGSGGD